VGCVGRQSGRKARRQWDDPLPTSLFSDGSYYHASSYQSADLTWLTYPDERDTTARLEKNMAQLAAADYLVIASNRVYGVVPRLPARYPFSSQYHPFLFDGALGFEAVYVGGRFPQIAGISLKPNPFSWPQLAPPAAAQHYLDALPGLDGGRFDESFTVYDQPFVMIFENKAHLSAKEMVKLFNMP